MKITLVPLKYDFRDKNGKRYVGYEQAMLVQDGQPMTMFHIDLLWNITEHKEIHERLCAGETVEVEVNFRMVDQ